jgi:endoglucanase
MDCGTLTMYVKRFSCIVADVAIFIRVKQYPEENWLADWSGMAARYASNPMVVAAELRNELRCATVGGQYLCPSWGDDVPATDWKAAAYKGAQAVLAHNPNLLIVVDGWDYSTNFTLVYNDPLDLGGQYPNRLVYAPHDYS